jgi:hypothetical protein
MPTPSQHEGRLDRIEAKLDQVAEAIIALARVEERTVAIQEMINGVRIEQNEMDGRVRELEKTSAKQGGGLSVYERAFWVILATIGGAITIAANIFFGG